MKSQKIPPFEIPAQPNVPEILPREEPMPTLPSEPETIPGKEPRTIPPVAPPEVPEPPERKK